VRFVLTIEDKAGPGDSPAANRLRLVLKQLLRRLGFALVRIEPADVPAPAPGATPAGPVGDGAAPYAPKPRRRF
jgi:hypothetical protein